ncbi:hypothetical protein J2Y48_003060 [Mycoplana sp. BE70]|uniref:hypothetical protein n=1 Tax=Mycoplana sp. BE70 TaxID=2817775 RepID=UPI002864AC5A|nr:hypothetical protein [Mycoplana sp. BE70]MDR6757763.1 hypothetical protein [Mycoplana sp. BE70]
MKNGVIYIAFGKRYVDQAIYSAKTLKAVSSLPVTLFSDVDVQSPYIDSVVKIEPQHKRAKVDYISRSPYERTLYLDCDTEVRRDISDIFGVLDRFDIAAVQDHCRKNYRWSSQIPSYDAIPYAFSEFNGGVLLYGKGPGVDAFFESWRSHFYANIEATNGQDQASLRIALWNSELKIHTLPIEFNVRNQRIRDKLTRRAKEFGHEGLLAPRIFHWHKLQTRKGLFRLISKYRPMKY